LRAAHAAFSFLPEEVPPVVADRQVMQVPDRVQLSGWVGQRITANEANRLVRVDLDRLLEAYLKRPGRQAWEGEHVGKWLHAATLAWANTGDPALRERLDGTVMTLQNCQLEDGYLGTYVPAERWTEWDVWAHKYNLLGLITYMRHTGDRGPLEACRRMAGLLCREFGDQPGQRDILLAGHHFGMAPLSVLDPHRETIHDITHRRWPRWWFPARGEAPSDRRDRSRRPRIRATVASRKGAGISCRYRPCRWEIPPPTTPGRSQAARRGR
jgi:DUF1680 family protein